MMTGKIFSSIDKPLGTTGKVGLKGKKITPSKLVIKVKKKFKI